MRLRSTLVLVGVAAATVAAELAWLPATARKTVGPDGNRHGPYTEHQAGGLVVTLLVIAVLGTLLVPAVFLVLVGSAMGSAAVTYAVHGLRSVLRPGPPHRWAG